MYRNLLDRADMLRTVVTCRDLCVMICNTLCFVHVHVYVVYVVYVVHVVQV